MVTSRRALVLCNGLLVIAAVFNAPAVGQEKDQDVYAWQAEAYRPPDAASYFPDDAEAGRRLDLLLDAADRDSRPDKEILTTVSQGLRRTKQHRTSVLRWIGNRYIWNRSPQNPEAIELMYHAADFSGPNHDALGTRHFAVYFGLSVVQPKTPAILRTLVDLCLKVDDPNDLGRVAWGAASQRAELLALLQPHLQSPDEAVRAKAQVLEKIFTGQLGAFQWAQEQARKRAADQFADELPRFKEVLLKGDSQARRDALTTIARHRIVLIMDDSFVAAFAACAEDDDPQVREQTAVLAGHRWVWSAAEQNAEAIRLMLQLSRDSNRNVRYHAVYYGLSTVRGKDEQVVRRLLEMAMADREPNLYRRIAWGLRDSRAATASILQEILEGDDPTQARHAREIYKDMTGQGPAN